jgi:hypothetical protein
MGSGVNILDPIGIAQGSKILDPLGLVQNPQVPVAPDIAELLERPTEVSPQVIAARKQARRIAATRQGRAKTILTSPQGLPSILTRS